MVDVVRVQPQDAERLRATRLAALRDAPSAFATTYADAAGRADEHWRTIARTTSSGADRATFIGHDASTVGPLPGMVAGYRAKDDPTLVHLVAMWVRPDQRGTGLGGRLVAAVNGWASDVGAARVELWVTTGNEAAKRLCIRCGFTEIAEYQPLPSDPCQTEVRMGRSV